MSRDYRYEIKFVVNDIKLNEVMQWLMTSSSMRQTYPERMINSVYFDDLQFHAVRDNIAGLPNREKFRFRWYSHDANESAYSPTLEKKVREGRLGYKESESLAHLQPDFLEADIATLKSNSMEQFTRLGLFQSSLKGDVFPALHVNYRRQYLEDANNIRLTVDSDIQFRHVNSCERLFQCKGLHWEKKVIEIKFNPQLKDKAAELIRPLHLVPQRCSKYLQGMAYCGAVKYL